MMITKEKIKEVDQRVLKSLKVVKRGARVQKVKIREMQKENLKEEVSLKREDLSQKDLNLLNLIRRVKEVARELKEERVLRVKNQNLLNQLEENQKELLLKVERKEVLNLK